MAYKYYSRSAKRSAKKSQRTFFLTIFLIILLGYATIQWILPSVIGGVGLINNTFKPPKKVETLTFNSIAPPFFDIPFDATNTSQINIPGYSTPNTEVKLYIDDQLKDMTKTQEDGKFEFREVTLSLGKNNIYGKTVDEKGAESLPSKTLSVVYDNEKPELSISEPEDGKTIQGGDKKVSIKGKTDPDVKVYINDVRIILNSDGNFSSEQSLNDGDNNFTIKAIDNASNETKIDRKVTYNP